MAGQVSWRWRLAGWLRRVPEFRGRDRLGGLILRGAPTPTGTIRCVVDHGLVFDARMDEDGSWMEAFFLQYESPSLAPVLDAFLRSGSTFVDVGANIGIYTGWASRSVGSSGRVIAFEPVPTTRGYLERVITLNALDNVTVVPKALGAGPGTASLWVVPHASGLSSAIAPADESSARRVDVPVSTLDDELSTAGASSPALVKIDVEGYEMSVLQGAVSTLTARDGPAVVFEAQDHLLAQAGVRFTDITAWLEDRFGYRLFALLPSGLQPIARTTTIPPAMNTLALHPERHRDAFDRLRRIRFRRNQNC
jgi:FkbM family methyltransferase